VFGVVLGFVECCKKEEFSMGLPTSPLYRLGAVGVQGKYARVVLQARRSVKIPRYPGFQLEPLILIY
jgi:hypothetical protein